MDKLFKEIGSQWHDVFGEAAKNLSKSLINQFAGFDPRLPENCSQFAELLGINDPGKQYLEKNAVDQNGTWIWDRISEVPSDKNLWNADSSLGISALERAQIYCRWRKYGGPLFTFSLIHQCREAYRELDCLLCHVNRSIAC